LIQELAENRAGILLISSEIDELVHVCDRVYVLREGRIVSELLRDDITKEAILSVALLGSNNHTEKAEVAV
jgi:ABC-type sugar transport system ATPase subunit